MKNSRTSAVGIILCIAGGVSLLGPFAVRALGLYVPSCVEEAPCAGAPPRGMSCNVVYPDDGSQAQTGGIAPSGDACAYVYASSNPGVACGSSVPLDPSSNNCQ